MTMKIRVIKPERSEYARPDLCVMQITLKMINKKIRVIRYLRQISNGYHVSFDLLDIVVYVRLSMRERACLMLEIKSAETFLRRPFM